MGACLMPEKSFKRIFGFLTGVIEGRQKVRRFEAGLLILLGALSVLLLAPAAVLAQLHNGYAAVIYLAVSVLVLGAVLARAVWLIKRPPSREKVALEIESELGDIGNNLISSLQLFPTKNKLGSGDPTSPALIDALVIETAEQIERLDAGDFVSNSSCRRLGKLAAGLGFTVLIAGFIWPGLYPRAGFLLANAVDLMPSRITHLYLSASSKRILPGSSVVFDVRTEGMSPGRVEIEVSDAGGVGDESVKDRIPMEILEENRFRLKWKGGDGDFRVVARAGRFRSSPIDMKVVAPPRVKVIEIVNFPPDYTPYPPTRQSKTANIRAFLGSSVLVRVKTSKPVSEALLSLAGGWRVNLKPGKEGFLEGLILVGSPASYQIRLKDMDGFANLDPPRYRIDIIPDTFPDVKVIKPAKDLAVEADDAVRVRYRATDDFGIRNVGLEVRLGRKAPRSIRLWGEENSKKLVQGSYVIDLRAFALRPGGFLTYRILAEDIDTVSGPKQGASPFYNIRIRDREAVIASLDKKLDEISSDLLNLLGDYLEQEVAPSVFKNAEKSTRNNDNEIQSSPKKMSKSLYDKAREVMKKVQAARDILRPNNPREALASMDLATLSQRLREAMNQYLVPPRSDSAKTDGPLTKKQREERENKRLSRREEATESIERLASMGEDMLHSVRMDRAGKSADELMQRQRALSRAFEQMRKSGGVDEASKQKVEQEIARLQKELNKLMQQLSNLAQRMPAEFMNQRGMRNLPMQNMMNAFDRIRQQMRQGNIRGALDTLRRLMSQIQRIRNAMRGLRRQQMSAQRGGRPMQRRQSELGAIVKEQQAVLSDTVGVFGNVIHRMKKGWPKGLEKLSLQFAKHINAEKKLMERIRAEDCVIKLKVSPSPSSEEPSDPRNKLRDALGAIPGAFIPGGLGASLSPEEKARVEKERREDIRRLHQAAVGELEKYLGRGDWGDIHGIVPRMGEMVQDETCLDNKEKEGARLRWRKALRLLDTLLKKAEKTLPANERQALAGLRKRQEVLEDRLTAFNDRLRQLLQLYPFLDPRMVNRLDAARDSMKDAKSSLGKRSSSAAIPHEERVLELLAQSQSQMNQSMRQMAQRGRLGMGTPRGLGAYRSPGRGWWAQNPRFPGRDSSQRRGSEGQDGRQGTDFSEVLIPDREQYQVPQKFREEVMEVLKEGLPDSLRSEIENYYERLTR